MRHDEIWSATATGADPPIPMPTRNPVGHRQRWVNRPEFAANVLTNQADAALADDLAELAREMTDERPLS